MMNFTLNRFFRAAFPEPFPVDTSVSVRQLFRFRLRGGVKIRLTGLLFLLFYLLLFGWVWDLLPFSTPLSYLEFTEQFSRFLLFSFSGWISVGFQLLGSLPLLPLIYYYPTPLAVNLFGYYSFVLPPFLLFYGAELYYGFLLFFVWQLVYRVVEQFPPTLYPTSSLLFRIRRYYIDSSWDVFPFIPYPPLAVLHWSYKRADSMLEKAEVEDRDSVDPDPPAEWRLVRQLNSWIGLLLYLLVFPFWVLARFLLFPLFFLLLLPLFFVRLFGLKRGAEKLLLPVWSFTLNRVVPPLDFIFQRISPLYSGYVQSIVASFNLVLDKFYSWAQAKIFELELWEEFLISTTYEKWREEWLKWSRRMRIRQLIYQLVFPLKWLFGPIWFGLLYTFVPIFKAGGVVFQLFWFSGWLVWRVFQNLLVFIFQLGKIVFFLLYRSVYLNRTYFLLLLLLNSKWFGRIGIPFIKGVRLLRRLYLRFFILPTRQLVRGGLSSLVLFFHLLPDRFVRLEARTGLWSSYLFWYVRIAIFPILLSLIATPTAYQFALYLPYKPGYTEGGVALVIIFSLFLFSDRFKEWSWWDLRDFFFLNLILFGSFYALFLTPSSWLPGVYMKVFWQLSAALGSFVLLFLSNFLDFCGTVFALYLDFFVFPAIFLIFYPVLGGCFFIFKLFSPLFVIFFPPLFKFAGLIWVPFFLLQQMVWFSGWLGTMVSFLFYWLISFFLFVVAEIYWVPFEQSVLLLLYPFSLVWWVIKSIVLLLVGFAPTDSVGGSHWWGW